MAVNSSITNIISMFPVLQVEGRRALLVHLLAQVDNAGCCRWNNAATRLCAYGRRIGGGGVVAGTAIARKQVVCLTTGAATCT